MKKEEAYSTLNLNSSASEEEAKKKFKELSKKYHPDICKEVGADEKFKKINQAYDSIKNQKFDDDQPIFNSGSGFGGFGGFDINNLNDLFFFNGMGGKKAKRNFPPIEKTINLSFKEAAFGVKKEIAFNRRMKCIKCRGEGVLVKHNGCGHCNGKGRVTRAQGSMVMTQTCANCHGRVNSDPCSNCGSSGSVPSDVTVLLDVPAGAFQKTLRLSNIGHYLGSNNFGDEHSDAYVHVNVEMDPNFEISDNDLVSKIDVNLIDALQGKEIEVQTLDGEVKINIPKLSKNKDEVVLPKLGIGRFGNQRIILNVKYPENIEKVISALKE
jgi:molecular chaperone DnaJ